MHKRLVALPGRQAAEHRRGGGREMVSDLGVKTRTVAQLTRLLGDKVPDGPAFTNKMHLN